MKTTIKAFLILSLFAFTFNSCKEEDEENELHLEFKTGTGYTYADATVAGGSAIKIGVEGETEKANDPIISFNISESVAGGTAATVHQQTLNDTDFDYDYLDTLGTTSGETHKYIFTITNRDGINKQVDLTVTVQ